MRYKYTNEDIHFLKINYPSGKWDLIHQNNGINLKKIIKKKYIKISLKISRICVPAKY